MWSERSDEPSKGLILPAPLLALLCLTCLFLFRNRVIISGLVGTLTHKRVKGMTGSRLSVFAKSSPAIQVGILRLRLAWSRSLNVLVVLCSGWSVNSRTTSTRR
jgi:hypothetical protein